MNTLATKQNTLKLLTAVALVFLCWISVSHAAILSIQDILWSFVSTVFGWLVGAAGSLLDESINSFVIGFGSLFTGNGGATSIGGAIDTSWAAVRDIFNLTFIFGLVYIGFKMILNSDDSNTRRWLVNLILAALLVNFSLFITKFIVDISNMLAASVLSGFPAGNISDAFMDAMDITTLLSYTPPAAAGGSGGYMYIFGAAIVFLIMAFVFAAGGLLVMIRFIALCFYMVMSPLMFLGWVFPQMSSITSQYWRGFLGRAFFAPIYILMLWFSYQVLSAVQGMSAYNNINYSAAFANPTPTTVPPMVVVLILGAGFLLASVSIASKMGADGAGAAISMGKNLQRRAQRGLQRGAVATGRFGARNTAGYAAQGLNAASEKTQRAARRMDARLSQKLNSLQPQSRLGRTTKKLASAALVNTAGGVDKVTGAGQRVRVAGSETAAEKRKRYEDRQNVRNATTKEATREKAVNDNLAIARDTRNTKEVKDDALTEVNNNMAKLSDERAVRLARENKASIMDPDMAAAFTDTQTKAIMESGILDNEEAKQFGQARNDGSVGDASQFMQTINDANASADDLNNAFKGLSTAIQRFSNERVTDFIGNDTSKTVPETVATSLSDKQLEHLKENLSTSKYKQVIDAREDGFKNVAENGSLTGANGQPIMPVVVSDPTKTAAENAAEVQRVTDEFIEKRRRELIKNPKLAETMPAEVFSNRNMASLITPQILQKRMEKGGLSDQERKSIEDNIQNYIQTASEREAKAWVNWSEKNTVGSNFEFTNPHANNQPNPNPAPAPVPPPPLQNPHDRFGSPAEAQRHADWEAQNNPNNNN